MGLSFSMSPPTKVGTPYGGRLIWALPGGNKLIAHLKDKAVIRHRKRWSQVILIKSFQTNIILHNALKSSGCSIVYIDGATDYNFKIKIVFLSLNINLVFASISSGSLLFVKTIFMGFLSTKG